MTEARRRELDLDGPGAPPRSNGELVFAAPWESRVFGITLALCEQGLFEWDDFRRLLIEEIASQERAGEDGERWSYYACWQTALERLLADRGICDDRELLARERRYAARPAGHDH